MIFGPKKNQTDDMSDQDYNLDDDFGMDEKGGQASAENTDVNQTEESDVEDNDLDTDETTEEDNKTIEE